MAENMEHGNFSSPYYMVYNNLTPESGSPDSVRHLMVAASLIVSDSCNLIFRLVVVHCKIVVRHSFLN